MYTHTHKYTHRFGTTPALLPDPVKRWKDFMFAVSLLNHREELVWGPITRYTRGVSLPLPYYTLPYLTLP